MNKYQSLFKIEERQSRKRGQEVLSLLLYCVVGDPGQLRHLFRWQRSLKNRSPIKDKRPWLTYSAVEELTRLLRNDMKVFEYGSGGSTLYIAPRVEELTSIEHDISWAKTVKDAIKSEGITNIEYRTIPSKSATLNGSRHQYFRSTKETNRDFRNYVTAINKYPDRSLDMVIVDGRARVVCVREAYRKIKPGGYLILDNSERKDYHEAFLFMRKRSSSVKNHFGVIAYGTSLMQTTIWKVKQIDERRTGY
jgi:predicted O-methyltransferase YrrM